MNKNLTKQYELRFANQGVYRNKVWKTLCAFFADRYFPNDPIVFDLGCGWGEFINNVEGKKKYGMDLNESASQFLHPSVEFFNQSCSEKWPLPDNSLDLVFSSNFLEHLPNKEQLEETLLEVKRCLKPQGTFVCLGPNIRLIPGSYWDFWDHLIPISDRSLAEILKIHSFSIEHTIPRFLPYTMSSQRQTPVTFLKLYLVFTPAWLLFGKQFLVVAKNTKKKLSSS